MGAGAGAAAGAWGAGLGPGLGPPPADAGLPGALGAGASAGADFRPPKASRRRRATGASTVDDADFTNSPCSPSRARTSLLVTPSSLANSCTRALLATTSPRLEATAVVGPRLGFSYDAWSSRLHGVLMFFATCSLAGVPDPSAPGRALKYSTTADVSGEPVMRNARTNARRRSAASRHCWSGCSHAPRPGRLPAESTVTAQLPGLSETAATRSSSTASSRFRHPTHVRTGPSGLRCARVWSTEVSRWITAQSTVTVAPDRIACRASGNRFLFDSRIGRRIAADIDAPTGQPSRQPRVLPLLADGQ